jgi:hypothetical protein
MTQTAYRLGEKPVHLNGSRSRARYEDHQAQLSSWRGARSEASTMTPDRFKQANYVSNPGGGKSEGDHR